MKKFKLLSTVAAAALLSAGAVSAQTSAGKNEKPQQESTQSSKGMSGQAAQTESKPGAEKRDTSGKAAKGENKGMSSGPQKSGQASSEEQRGKAPGEQADQSKNASVERSKAEHGNRATMERGKSNQAKQNELKGERAGARKPSASSEAQQNEMKGGKAETQKPSTSGQAVQEKSGPQKASPSGQAPSTSGQATQQKGTQQPNAVSGMQTQPGAQTTGEVRGANLNEQQVTKVQQAVFSSGNVPRVENVDFALNVGIAVPSHVHLVRVPETLVEIYPQWRGDEYFVVRDEIVIVDHSRKIVAVMPARSRGASITATATEVNLSRAEIREIQLVLIHRGLLHGKADGMWGSETRQALITFQQREGIQANGAIDERTVSSLGLSGKVHASGAQGGTGASTTGTGQMNAPQGQGSTQGQQGNMSQGQQPRAQTMPNGQGQQSNGQQPSAAPSQAQSQGPANPSTTGQGPSKEKKSTESQGSTTGQEGKTNNKQEHGSPKQ